jgi:hypothetical protein
MTWPNPTASDLDRAMLAAELRGLGQQLAHIGSMICGRQSVTAADLRMAIETVRRADRAIEHYVKRTPPASQKETR